MNKFVKYISIAALVISASACTRITTGEVGVRVDASRQVQGTELQPGSWNQTLIGDVITFPVKDVAVEINDKRYTTADNSALQDFDMTVVYSINPSSVSELYTSKSKAFHYFDEKEKDTYLMYNYMHTLANNAAYKVVRKYNNLEVGDNRQKMEVEIRENFNEQLKAEKLDVALQVTAVQIRSVMPNAEILQAATALVRSQNELKIKDNEVQIAKKEAERMQALAVNSKQSVEYMEAQAKMKIAEAIANGKVQTIIVPSNMTSLMINK